MHLHLLTWYDDNRRDLPWRVRDGYPQAYHVLLSELMLQQTQVATVIPYFQRFIERFPTLVELASADEQEVLRLWQGLGYYSRARNLQKAARKIVERHAGVVPRSVVELLDLPGIGRYTAGAIASLAYGVRAPILDGNVQRVLCRLDAITADPRQTKCREALWARAEHILPKSRVADFNSALMELGATLCTPRHPQCLICPVRAHCLAMQQGIQAQIPPAKPATIRPLEQRWVFCIEHQGKWLIEQRPPAGRWAGMWQFITIPRGKKSPTLTELPNLRVLSIKRLGCVKHDLTHRRYEFVAYACTAGASPKIDTGDSRKWVTIDQMQSYPFPKPHLNIIAMCLESSL